MSETITYPTTTRRKRKIAGVPVAIVEAGARRDNYIARADQVTESDYKLLKFLYDVRVTTRDRLREVSDPLAFHLEMLPTPLQPKLSQAEIVERQLRARRNVDTQVTRLREPSLVPPLGALGFIEVTAQRAEETSDKARALCRSGASRVQGRLPELITLSKEGLFYVKGRLGIDDEAPPFYKAFQRAHSRLAHQLATSDILLSLMPYEQVGVLEVISIANEYAWVTEMTDGTPASYGQRILVTDNVLTCRPKGLPDGADDEAYLIEVDCGSQDYGWPAKGQDPTRFLPWKIHNYYVLAKKLSKQKQGRGRRGYTSLPLLLCPVVPIYGRTKPETRMSHWVELFDTERRDQSASGAKDHALVELMREGPMTNPTPENFALFVAGRMELRRRARAGAKEGQLQPTASKAPKKAPSNPGEVSEAEWSDVTPEVSR